MISLAYAMGSYGGGGEGGGGFGAFIPLILMGVVFYFLFKSRSTTTMNQFTTPILVLREFNIGKLGSKIPLVTVRGRASGFISWLLTVFRINSESSLILTEEKILFQSSSLYGEIQQVVPFSNVSSTRCGYYKPITYLISAGISLLLGLIFGISQNSVGLFFLLLILAGIFLTAYWLSKTISIAIETFGGMIVTIRFKRSVIENIPLDIEMAKKVINIISHCVVKAQSDINPRQKDFKIEDPIVDK